MGMNELFTMLREGYDPPISRSLKAMNAYMHSETL